MDKKKNSYTRKSKEPPKSMKPQQSQKQQNSSMENAGDESFIDGNISEDDEGGTRIGDIYIPPPIQPHCSTQSKGPRLIITHIENENFKSYAGKVVLGPFHHCFTAIIGPNGSGKSNVIDSMLFVFGYRAQKIRCKKLSVLLHNSAKHPNMEMCRVAVHFKQVLDQEDFSCKEIENSEIIVGRTAFRDNSSFYTINDKRVHFKEVSKLLKQHGVDLDHNRFLILQGEVESIAMMKSKGQTENECGMLEYLEDIVGTTRYKEPLVKINAKVENLTEERTEKHNRCKLAEREMKDLEQPYNEAVDYLKLENALARTKSLQIQKYLSEQNKKLIEFNGERDKVVNELEEHDTAYNELRKERLEKENLIKDEIEKYEKICKEKENKEIELKTTLTKYSEIQEIMKETNKRRKLNHTQLEKNDNKLIELKNISGKNDKEILECEKKIERSTKQKTDLENQLQQNYTELETQTRPLIDKREKYETELIDLKKVNDEAKSELVLAEQELKILIHDETSEKRKFVSLKCSLDESEKELIEKKSNIGSLTTEITEIKVDMESKSKELKNFEIQEQQIRENLFALKADISEKQSSMQVAKSNNKVLDTLMREKVNGNIPGILGRLGDLGAINAKYDVAISTACGRLDNIIVDTVNTAQTCIEHLKRTQAGRASFIALEKVENYRRYCENRIQTPENVARLFDLVEVEDERVLPAFYFALRDTLVADGLDQGTRIAYGVKRYRVVTLQGDVIETSGTMSGGGRTQLRGRMGQKVTTKTGTNARNSIISQKALENLQRDAEAKQMEINFCQQEQGRLENELLNLKRSLQLKEAEIQKITITIESHERQLPLIKKNLEEQTRRVEKTKTDPVKVASLEEKVKSAKNEFDESEKVTQKITKKIDDINQKIAEIHGEKVKSVQQKITNLTKEINSLNNNISKLKVEITTSQRNYKKIENEIANLRSDIKKAEEQIISLKTNLVDTDKKGIDLAKEIDDLKETVESANKNSSHIQKKIIEIQRKESESELKRVEIDETLKNIEKKISDIKSQVPHWQNKLRPLKLHEIPGEMETLEPFKTYTEEELNSYKLQDLQYQYSVQEEKLNSKKPNLSVVQEYTNKREAYLDRVQVLEDITNKRNEMRQLYDDVRKKRYTEFMKGFHIITRKLKEMYQMITQGGDAELELVDSMDPFTEGVSFSVRPPKKSWKNISNLSGGEKTLSSLALVFALHYYKPSPLYFMDEIDAALDFKNISIVAHYIKERTKNAQFIIISLRSNMFELSDYIVGIYKVSDCTNSITIQNYPPDFGTSTEIQVINKNIGGVNKSIVDEISDNVGGRDEISDDVLATIQNTEHINEEINMDTSPTMIELTLQDSETSTEPELQDT